MGDRNLYPLTNLIRPLLVSPALCSVGASSPGISGATGAQGQTADHETFRESQTALPRFRNQWLLQATQSELPNIPGTKLCALLEPAFRLTCQADLPRYAPQGFQQEPRRSRPHSRATPRTETGTANPLPESTRKLVEDPLQRRTILQGAPGSRGRHSRNGGGKKRVSLSGC